MVGTRFSAFRSRRSHRLPPAILRGQIVGTPLMRFSTFPSAFPGCAVPSAGNQPANHPAPAFSQPPAPRPSVVAPMRFSAPRASICFHCVRLETSPTRVIRRRLHFSGRRTGPASGSYRSLAGTFGPGNAHGICSYPSQYCSASRVSASFDVSIPPAVSPATVREFHRRGVRFLGRTIGLGPRLLGLTMRSSRTVRSVGPAMAFAHRADQIHQSLLPWA